MKLSDFSRSVLCQFGQDGVVQKLVEEAGVKSKYFVEFGSSGDDLGAGNTPNLRRLGWNGLLMDAVTSALAKYQIHTERITAGNIEGLLSKYHVPKDLGFLSIDIDGQDYWVWESIKHWHPAIVCIEANHYLEDQSVTVPLDDKFAMTNAYYFGASRIALMKLGISKGYSLVAICVTDMIFCRNDLLPKNIERVNEIRFLDTAKTWSWVSEPIRAEVRKHQWVNV